MNMKNLSTEAQSVALFQDLFGLTGEALSEPVLAYRCGYQKTAVPASDLEIVETNLHFPLPYADFHFSYAVSSYPFFTKEDDTKQILMQLKELVRIAKEVRLAPHLLKQEQVAKKFGPVILALQQESVGVEITPLPHPHFDHAVRIKLWAHECKLQ